MNENQNSNINDKNEDNLESLTLNKDSKDQETKEDDLQDQDNIESSDSEDFNENKYSDGQEVNFVRVRFPGNSKSFPFTVGRRKFRYGQKVVALSDRGMAVGYINSFEYKVKFNKNLLPIKNIHRVATDKDLINQRTEYLKIKETETLCNELIQKLKLSMEVTHVEFTQYGKKAVFYFTAKARVDFRQLVRDLVQKLKIRIELRQISIRDRSAAIGGLGSCGRELCCSSFLSKYGNVNIKMAKNQSLSLLPSKLNGVCGQLKCCIEYEDKVYSHKRKNLPKEGNFISVKNGDKGKVLRLYVFEEHFQILTDSGKIRRYKSEMYDENISLPKSYKFPSEFETIDDESKDVISLPQETTNQIDEKISNNSNITIENNTKGPEKVEEKSKELDKKETQEPHSSNQKKKTTNPKPRRNFSKDKKNLKKS
jgi:cell fate regulator YaaT (PSP1 superfamily)